MPTPTPTIESALNAVRTEASNLMTEIVERVARLGEIVGVSPAGSAPAPVKRRGRPAGTKSASTGAKRSTAPRGSLIHSVVLGLIVPSEVPYTTTLLARSVMALGAHVVPHNKDESRAVVANHSSRDEKSVIAMISGKWDYLIGTGLLEFYGDGDRNIRLTKSGEKAATALAMLSVDA